MGLIPSLQSALPWTSQTSWTSPQPWRPQAPIPAMGSAVASTPLVNGATGHLAHLPHQPRSLLAVAIPVDALPTGTEDMVPYLLENGSEATRRMLSGWRNQGLHFWVERLDDQMLLKAAGPAGREPVMAQAALQLLTRPMVDEPSFRTGQDTIVRNLRNRWASPDAKLQAAMGKAMYGPFHTFSLTDAEKMRILSRYSLPEITTAYGRMLQSIPASRILMLSPQPPAVQQQILNEAVRQAGWFQAPGAVPALSPSSSLPRLRGRSMLLMDNPALQRALIKIAWKAPDALSPDYPAHMLLKEIVGGRANGSFFQTLRTQHGLVYSVSGGEGEHLAEGSPYQADLEVAFDKIGPALADVDAVMFNLSQSPVLPVSMGTLKRKALLRIRDMLQTPEATARLYEPWLKQGLPPPDPATLQAAIDRVQPEDIRRVAQGLTHPGTGFQLTGVAAPAWVLSRWFPGYPILSCPT